MIFIFGYGYTAKHLSSMVSDKKIVVTSRSLNSLNINQKNIEIIDPSKTSHILEKHRNEITHLVISVPPDQSGDIFLKNINIKPTIDKAIGTKTGLKFILLKFRAQK